MVNCDYLYNKNYFNDNIHTNRFSANELRFRIINDATLLPCLGRVLDGHWDPLGGIVDGNGNLIPNTFVHHGGGFYHTTNIPYVDETVVYLGMLSVTWGHCIMESLSRIWFLTGNFRRHYLNDYRIVYTVAGGNIPANFVKLLKILGVDLDNCQEISAPTKFRNIVVPDACLTGGGGLYSKEYIDTIEQVRAFALRNYSPIAQKKLFLFHGRTQFGEEFLAQYFHDKGYSIVVPERLPLEEQLNILINCQNFASTLGSASHNIMFMPDRTEVIIIPRRLPRSSYQDIANSINDINIFYIDSALSIFAHGPTDPFCYVVSNPLRKFFGDNPRNYTDQDFTAVLAYIKFALSKGLKPNHDTLKYYGNIWQDFFTQLRGRTDLQTKIGLILK